MPDIRIDLNVFLINFHHFELDFPQSFELHVRSDGGKIKAFC